MAVDGVERGLRFGAGVLLASLAAGPIFWFSAILISLPTNTTSLDWALLWIATITIPYGGIFAFLPIVIGAAAMTALSAWLRWARSRLAWIGAGGLGGALYATINVGALPNEWQVPAAMVLTGMGCAAICHAITRWPDGDDGAQA
jgi:hypothetical protein